jgi:hypothetical protein
VTEHLLHDLDISSGGDSGRRGGMTLRRNSAEAALGREVAARWGVAEDVEFHAYDIMQGHKPWQVLRGRTGDAASLYRKLLRTVVACGARVIVQAVDVTRFHQAFTKPASPHEAAVRRALEQLDRWCQDDGTGPVSVVSDEISADTTFATDMFARAINGTTTTASPGHPGPLRHVASTVSLVSSAHSTGVQAADLVAHIARRHFEESVAASSSARRLARSLYHTAVPAVAFQRKWEPVLGPDKRLGTPKGPR